MVSKVIWDESSTPTEIMTTQLNTLINNTITTASTTINNDTDLDMYYWLELNVTFGTAPSDTVPTVDVYKAESLDGTNFQSDPVTGGTDCMHQFVGSFPVRKVTSAQRLIIGPFLMGPNDHKLFLDNQTGQSTASSGNTLDFKPANPEGQ